MIVGLVIKLAPGNIIQDMVKFKEGFFFNLLLPPIILNSGYELKRVSIWIIIESDKLIHIVSETFSLISVLF